MQSGGGDPMMMKLLLIVFALIAASNPKLAALLEIFAGQGSNIQGQYGGGGPKKIVIQGLENLQKLYGSDMSLPQETRDRINTMIPRLMKKISEATENSQVEDQPLDLSKLNEEISKTVDSVSPNDGNMALIDKLRNVFLSKVELYKTKLNTLLEGKIQSIKQKYGLDDTDVEDINFLKSVVINDVLGKKDELFKSIKDNRDVIAAMAAEAAAAAKNKTTQFFGTATDTFKTGVGNYLNSSPRAAALASAVKENSAEAAAAAKEKGAQLFGRFGSLLRK